MIYDMTRFRKHKFRGIFELIIGVGTKNGPAIPEKSAKIEKKNFLLLLG